MSKNLLLKIRFFLFPRKKLRITSFHTHYFFFFFLERRLATNKPSKKLANHQMKTLCKYLTFFLSQDIKVKQ